MKKPAFATFCAILFTTFAGGCLPEPSLDLGEPGKSFTYSSGSPAFDMEAVPSGVLGGTHLFISIPPASLMYVKANGGFLASFETTVALYAIDSSDVLFETSWADTSFLRTYEESQRTEPLEFERELTLTPGDYRVHVSIEDRMTRRLEVREQLISVPSRSTLRPTLGRLVLQYGDSTSGKRTLIPFNVEEGTKGFSASVHVYGVVPGSKVHWTVSLYRFRITRIAAEAPQNFALIAGAGEPKPWWFDKPDTLGVVQSDSRADESGSSADVPLTGLPPGLYDVQVRVTAASPGSGGDTVLQGERVFSMKPKGFPRPRSIRELVNAMVYINTPHERIVFSTAQSEKELQAIFDSLWLEFQPRQELASRLINEYYTRVEEANRKFSDMKDGWMTDRGMLYVVLGPPEAVVNSPERVVWYYTIPGSSESAQFVFRRVILGSGSVSLMTYVLERSLVYEQFWSVAVARWRSGRGI